MQAPLKIEVTRGPAVESSHLVHAVLMNGSGETIAAYGDPHRLTFPRSSLKPLQALALVESGGAEAFNLTDAEIALACASHSGEEKHTSGVAQWLSRLGLDDRELECGAHAPYSLPGAPPSALCNNCSGKHAGMLTLARHLDAPVRNYTQPEHLVQQKILGTMAEMCGTGLSPSICGIDGCSAPNPAMPLDALARGFARFMDPAQFSMARGAACRQIFTAMVEHPDLVAGTGRIDTVLMQAAGGKIMSKGGGEGVCILVIPGKNVAVALKAEDGAQRATQAAVYLMLERHGLAESAVLDAIRPLALPVLKNWRGLNVGEIRGA